MVEWNSDGTLYRVFHESATTPGYLYEHDINWCARDQESYYHYSGGGPAPVFLARKLESCRGKIWAAPGLEFTCWVGKRGEDGATVPIKREDIGTLGYDLVDDDPGDPLPELLEGTGYWCEFCDDWLPDSEPCKHVDAVI
jgi:hypothetical protein